MRILLSFLVFIVAGCAPTHAAHPHLGVIRTQPNGDSIIYTVAPDSLHNARIRVLTTDGNHQVHCCARVVDHAMPEPSDSPSVLVVRDSTSDPTALRVRLPESVTTNEPFLAMGVWNTAEVSSDSHGYGITAADSNNMYVATACKATEGINLTLARRGDQDTPVVHYYAPVGYELAEQDCER